ncbi:Uncharacterised protein [Segatella copri]|nr:Uncharacterised protein [Segatella copri]
MKKVTAVILPFTHTAVEGAVPVLMRAMASVTVYGLLSEPFWLGSVFPGVSGLVGSV